MKLKIIVIYILALVAALSVSAEAPSDSAKVVFLVGQSQFNPDLGNNGANMANFICKVERAKKDKDIDHITVSANASPDGSVDRNRQITEERCASLVNYLIAKTGVSRGSFVTLPGGEAWNELRELVEATPDVPQREQVLKIIDNTPVWIFNSQRNIIGGRKKRLMDLGGGYPFRWMEKNLFPKLRNAVAVVLYYSNAHPHPTQTETERKDTDLSNTEKNDIPLISKPADAETEEAAAETEEETAAAAETEEQDRISVEPENTEKYDRIQRLAIKTNLLYDAALLPNLELEFLINDKWSVALEGDVAWWKKDSEHKYYDLAIISAEGRRWFKVKQPWHGMYAGFFAGGGKYDFENGGKGYYGEGGYAGLSFGYVLPLGKYFLLDAGIGAGYMQTRYKEYRPFDGHYLYERTKTLNYFGPLKLKVSIGWRFYKTNVTNKNRTAH